MNWEKIETILSILTFISGNAFVPFSKILAKTEASFLVATMATLKFTAKPDRFVKSW